MEENVSLDASKQKKFDKSIKGIKKLIKKKDGAPKAKIDSSEKVKTGRVSKKKRPQRGLVYLSHIPHGFYENEMTQYFKQFGVVTNVRVIRSKRTGQSKGFAFIEFKEPAVGEIVADTMNNYLMGKRLLKANYISPEKQKHKVFRKRWNAVNNPGNNLRIRMKKAHNENKDENGELKRGRQLLSNINKTKKKLNELGIDYDFFAPVDIPELLINKVPIKEENEVKKENVSGKSKKNKRNQENGTIKTENSKDVQLKISSNTESKKEQKKNIPLKISSNTESKKEQKENKFMKNKNIKQETMKITQKQLLKDKGVTPLEDFVKVGEGSDNESDSSTEFDSDEFEKMLQDDDNDSDLSEDASDDDEDSRQDDAVSDESEEQHEQHKPKGKNKPGKVTKVPIKQSNTNGSKKQKKAEAQPQQAKRQASQKPPVAPFSKKPKFEKQSNQKPRSKQFKKKK